jgi:signal peptidase I
MSDVKFIEGPESDHASGGNKGNKTLTYAIEGAILVLALLLGLLIRFGVYETAIVTSDSMRPTLARNDRLLIDHRNSLHGKWQRGDMVIFEPPSSWSDESDTYIKRIVGLPGETVEIRGGQVWINGRQLQENYINGAPEPEHLQPFQLPPGQYWVMGDNRNNSFDSRRAGPLPDASILGRAVYRLGPLGRTGGLPAPSY